MSSEVKTQVVWLPDGFGGGEHVEVCRATDYAALEAENARLTAQLAAIQGGMGEDVAVLATVSMGGIEYGIGGAELGDIDIQPDMKALCALQQSLVTGEDDAHVELIDKAQHQRITAAMAAQIEANEAAFAKFIEDHWRPIEAERDALRAELAELKGREAVAWVDVKDRHVGPYEFHGLELLDKGKHYLFVSPPASPDVEGLVKALESARDYIGSQPVKTSPWRDGIRSGRRLDDGAMGTLRILDKIDTALSTWRQAQDS